jgi:hypothetical protein
MLRLLAVAASILLLAGCGAPHELTTQADEVHSLAAEGALLAHEAADGDAFAAFTTEHSAALRGRLGELRPAIEDAQLATIAAALDRTLRSLGSHPGDHGRAAVAERALSRLADRAEELGR